MSLCFSKISEKNLKMLFWVGMMGGRNPKQLSPRHFPILESICGMGVEVQPLWVKGFRSHFNSLADIRAVR